MVALGVPGLLPYVFPFVTFHNPPDRIPDLTRDMQGADGSRQPTPLELEVAESQGKAFYEHVARVNYA